MIKLLEATYGGVDVKSVIEKDYIKNDIIKFSVSNDIFGDTLPNSLKKLIIKFEYNDELIEMEAIEGEIFLYPEEISKRERRNFLKQLSRESLLSTLKLKGLGIEIGVQSGEFSESILKNTDLHLIIVDSWRFIEEYGEDFGNCSIEHHLVKLNETLNRLIKYDNRFTLIREFSEKIVLFFKDELFDFIYLDANHTEAFMVDELNRWWSKLKVGGIMAGHDYVNRFNIQVKNAVDKFFEEKNIEVEVCDFGCCPTWFVTKI